MICPVAVVGDDIQAVCTCFLSFVNFVGIIYKGLPPESSCKRPFYCFFTSTGHRQTAFKAAVTVLRGNGGSFPSQAQMSDPQGCAGTGRRDALRRVILQVVQSVRHSPMYVPDLSEIYMVLTNLVHSGLGEYCPIRTRLN